MLSEEDKEVFRLIGDKVHSEYLIGESSDEFFWKNIYQKIPINKRMEFWFIEIVTYEYMVHGEFSSSSIDNQVNFLIKIITEKDQNSKEVIIHLYRRLLTRPLQNDDISEYMAKKIEETKLF
jgi:hypothetical protein